MPDGSPTLIGVPYDASSSYLAGTAHAPPLIRQALHSDAGNSWTEGLIDLSLPGALDDAGDLALANVRGEADRLAIEDGVRAVLERGGRPIVLGGDHSISYPVLRAIRARYARLTILHVDAHADLYDVFEGDRYSHACSFARICEERLTDHLVQVGIRTMPRHHREQADRFAVDIIEMHDWDAGSRPSIDGPVYVSIDLDGLDPAHAPGVSHREPGGLTVRDVLGMLRRLSGPIVGADVVEFNPAQDPSGMTAWVAAKFVKELAGAMQRSST